MSFVESPIIILASASPRRAELLRQLGVDFQQCPVDLDESVGPGEAPLDYVKRLALAKAQAVSAMHTQVQSRLVLGSDTSVVLDECIFGKPADEAEAVDMLQALSGRVHQVMTAVALVTAAQKPLVEAVVTQVRFRSIELAEMRAYWRTGEPRDKAGGYAIQGKGAIFVQQIEGSYSGVMGLPLFETAAMLRRSGYSLWPTEER